MLTSDLAFSWRRGDKIFPRLIKTNNQSLMTDAENLNTIFAEFIGKTRGELERELEEYVGTGTDYRILRGFIKLLSDRSEFQTESAVEPFEIRQKIFLEARKFQPVLPNSEQRKTVLETIAKDEFQLEPTEVENNLYADLSAQQRLIEFETIAPEDLLNRYNLAQAQALLYKCVEMKIRIAPSETSNYRAIFGWIKHFKLIHSVIGNAVNGYEITLTGAASLFHRSQKYGIRMAVFLPTLLICKNWKMTAEIPQKERNYFYELTSEQTELVSFYFDDPEYVNSDIEKLKKNFEKRPGDWRLEENREVVDLGKTAFIPDLCLVKSSGEKVYLDVLGFWTPKSLLKRIEEFRAANYNKFILAASQELRGSREESLWESPNVIFYKTKLEPLALIEMAEKLIK
ncbi:MAG TPA: DUF790 family protein [Pyrinomonadaceae bacterium]|nr:DUF790 family protein [Pyrinomonadaceae bacterium]